MIFMNTIPNYPTFLGSVTPPASHLGVQKGKLAFSGKWSRRPAAPAHPTRDHLGRGGLASAPQCYVRAFISISGETQSQCTFLGCSIKRQALELCACLCDLALHLCP